MKKVCIILIAYIWYIIELILYDGHAFPIDSIACLYTYFTASAANLLTQSTFLIAPLNLTEQTREKLLNTSYENVYVCYKMQGEHGRTFSLLSDTWISINVQYYISVSSTYISAVGITLLDNDTAQCIKVEITAQQCSATINGEIASTGSSVIGGYQFQFTSSDKSLLISRQGRPNRFSPVVRVSCLPSSTSVNENNLYLYLSDALPLSHGILGEWIYCSNECIQLQEYNMCMCISSHTYAVKS